MLSKLSSRPKQYTQGWVEFYKLKFRVTPDVLIPRPETELLVDDVIRFLSNHPERPKGVEGSPYTILDLGTGSGNIAISIAKNLPSHLPCGNVKIIATDISSKALKVAGQNAKLHGVKDRITFLRSDLMTNVPRSEDIWLIVTNLPYIPSARIPYLDASVRDFEPKVALDGGEDGFELYRKLFKQIKEKNLVPKLLLGEIDYTHGELAVNEALKYFPNAEVEVKTDLTKKQRILKIIRKAAAPK